MSLRVQIAHVTTGRARIQLPEHRGDPEFFDRIVQLIEQSGIVRSARANPVTGSIVLEFDGDAEDLLTKLAALVPIEIVAPQVAAQLRSPWAGSTAPFKLVSGRDIDPMLMAGTLFGAVGVVQTVRGRVLIPALAAFWCAANAFRMARDQKPGSAATD
jgi:hypothetical protein